MKNKLIEKAKEWLGINKLEKENKLLRDQIKSWGMMAVDLSGNERDESFIVVATRLNGGMVKIIRTRFGSMTEALDLVRGLQSRYEVREPIKDMPKGFYF